MLAFLAPKDIFVAMIFICIMYLLLVILLKIHILNNYKYHLNSFAFKIIMLVCSLEGSMPQIKKRLLLHPSCLATGKNPKSRWSLREKKFHSEMLQKD